MTDKEVSKTFEKRGRVGDGTPGPGRPKGMKNKATIEFRETVQRVLESNAQNVGKWLAQVAEGIDPDPETGFKGVPAAPEKALDLLAKLAEFAAPKLARTEHVGDGGGPVRIVATNLDEKL